MKTNKCFKLVKIAEIILIHATNQAKMLSLNGNPSNVFDKHYTRCKETVDSILSMTRFTNRSKKLKL